MDQRDQPVESILERLEELRAAYMRRREGAQPVEALRDAVASTFEPDEAEVVNAFLAGERPAPDDDDGPEFRAELVSLLEGYRLQRERAEARDEGPGVAFSLQFESGTCECGFGPVALGLEVCPECAEPFGVEDPNVVLRRRVAARSVAILAAPTLAYKSLSMQALLSGLASWHARFFRALQAAAEPPHAVFTEVEETLEELRRIQASVVEGLGTGQASKGWRKLEGLASSMHASASHFLAAFTAATPEEAAEHRDAAQRQLDGLTGHVEGLAEGFSEDRPISRGD